MTRDFENELRRSLQTRAGDVTPDPAMYARVQSRIRRGRTFRFAAVGAAAALAVAGAAVAAPRMIERRIEFEPGPVATQPAPLPTQDSAVPGVAKPSYAYSDGQNARFLDGRTGDEWVTMLGDGSGLGRVTLRPDTGSGPLTVVAERVNECYTLAWDSFPRDEAVTDSSPGGVVPSSPDLCATSPVFSPDGRHLASLERAGPDEQFSLRTVDWTAEGPGENDASFGLPGTWPADQPVDIQDWVWTEQTATTAKGYLAVRTQREGAWMVLMFPIERQADGALAMTFEAAPVTGMTSDFTPVAYTTNGGDVSRNEDATYTMEVVMGPDAMSPGRIVSWVGGESGGVLDLPPELFSNTNPPFDVSDLWMSAAGNTLLYGNAGTKMAWSVDWSQVELEARQLTDSQGRPLEIVHADLVTAAAVGEAPLGEGETGGEGTPAVGARQVDVFFGMTGADACVADQPVQRDVVGTGVARAALTELLAGPTSTESNEGIESPFNANTAGALNAITIVDGQARVDFADFSADIGDDSCTKSAILDALNNTLKQFPSIESTRYSFEGDTEAWVTWLGGARGPAVAGLPEPVAETAEQIHAAATNSDWRALRGLSRETSCTLSDQKESCVPYWKAQEANGEEPLAGMLAALEGEPSQNPDSPSMWVWPVQMLDGNYDGPRIGIDEDGVWRYYVQSGG